MRKMSYRLLPLFGIALLMAGCGSDSGDYSKYVTLGDYQNLKVTKTVEKVTAERVDEYEKEQLEEYVEYETVDGPVKEGQLVDVSLLAKSGDEVVYDFSDDGYEMVIGDGEFGEQVDEALIGSVAADELDLEVSYDDSFEDAMLAGHTISYHIVVNSISDVTYPELTNEFVKENFGVTSVDEWRASLKEELQQSYEEEAEDTLRTDLVQAAVDACTISGYPKSLYKQKKQEVESSYQSYADMFNCSLSEVYDMLDMDEQAREKEYIDAVNETMVLAEIRKQENLTLTDEQMQKRMEAYAQENEYDSVSELLGDYDENGLKEYFLNEAAIDYLEAHATITEG